METPKTEIQILVINRVKKLRVERNISQQQLASIIDATSGTIGNIESLKYPNKYTLPQLNTIAHHCSVPVESFFKTEDESIDIGSYTDRVCEYLS